MRIFRNNSPTTAKAQLSIYTALHVTDLNYDYWKQPHNVFSKFTYIDRCKLFGKFQQRKLWSYLFCKLMALNYSPGYMMWIFRKPLSIKAEVYHIKYIYLKVKSLWLNHWPIAAKIFIPLTSVIVVPNMILALGLRSYKSYVLCTICNSTF